MAVLLIALENHRIEYGTYPTTSDISDLLRVLQGDNERKVVFIKVPKHAPATYVLDRWGTPFRVESSGISEPRLISAGPDREFGTPDDIPGK
jgi:hypothetical protein